MNTGLSTYTLVIPTHTPHIYTMFIIIMYIHPRFGAFFIWHLAFHIIHKHNRLFLIFLVCMFYLVCTLKPYWSIEPTFNPHKHHYFVRQKLRLGVFRRTYAFIKAWAKSYTGRTANPQGICSIISQRLARFFFFFAALFISLCFRIQQIFSLGIPYVITISEDIIIISIVICNIIRINRDITWDIKIFTFRWWFY